MFPDERLAPDREAGPGPQRWRAAERLTSLHPFGAPPLARLRGVRKSYGTTRGTEADVLRGIDLVVESGAVVLVEGPSGSGKTTLLAVAGCMVRPTAGRVQLAGREVTRLPEDELARLRRRQVGFVFQSHHLIRGVSALDNVMVPGIPCPGSSRDLRSRAAALLARLGLADLAEEPVERLSGGEQQRVAIARALVNDPPLLLADEPTAHLDPATARAFLDLLVDLRDGGRTLLVASHDPVLAGSGLFSRTFALREGRLEEGGARGRRWS